MDGGTFQLSTQLFSSFDVTRQFPPGRGVLHRMLNRFTKPFLFHPQSVNRERQSFTHTPIVLIIPMTSVIRDKFIKQCLWHLRSQINKHKPIVLAAIPPQFVRAFLAEVGSRKRLGRDLRAEGRSGPDCRTLWRCRGRC